MRIRFDQGPRGPGTCFKTPHRVIRADHPHQVPAALEDLDAARAAGGWLAGYASYELGYALEPKLASLMPDDRQLPLMCFGVYDAPVARVGQLPAMATKTGLHDITPRWGFDRYAAAFAALLLGPLQPFMASASIERDPISTEQVIEKKDRALSSGMRSMTDTDMGEVTAQGVNSNIATVQDILANTLDTSDNGESTLSTLGNLLMPASDLLDADVEMTDVTYADGPRTTLNADGSITVALPSHIGQLAFKNVRVQGGEGEHLGDLFIKDIDLSNVDVTIRLHN